VKQCDYITEECQLCVYGCTSCVNLRYSHVSR